MSNFMFSCVEHENIFIAAGPGLTMLTIGKFKDIIRIIWNAEPIFYK